MFWIAVDRESRETNQVGIDIGIESDFDPARLWLLPLAFDHSPLDQPKASDTKACGGFFVVTPFPFIPESIRRNSNCQ